MGIVVSKSGNLNLSNGEIVVSQGQTVSALFILTAGKLEILKAASDDEDDNSIGGDYRLGHLGPNSFPAVQSLFTGKDSDCTYRAAGPCTLYAAPMQTEQQLQSFMGSKPDHAVAIASTLMMTIDALAQAMAKLQRLSAPISTLVENAAIFFWVIKETLRSSLHPSGEIFKAAEQNLELLRGRNFQIANNFDANFMNEDHSAKYGGARLPDFYANPKQIEYYRRVVRLAPAIRKAFFTSDPYINFYACQDMAACLGKSFSDIEAMIDRFEDLFAALSGEDEECLFTQFARANFEAARRKSENPVLQQTIDYLKQKTSALLQDFTANTGRSPVVDFACFERIFQQEEAPAGAPAGAPADISIDMDSIFDDIAPAQGEDSARSAESSQAAELSSSDTAPEEESPGLQSIAELPSELKGALKRIVDYSGIVKEKADVFIANVENFRKLKDRSSPDDAVRKLRRAISVVFFEIYEAAFKRMFKERTKDRLIEMFINFGFMDERLLDPNITMRLYTLRDPSPFNSLYPVYTMTEWLSAVYKREKEPSIDDFGNDYMGVFRELRKSGDIREEEKDEYENNLDRRLHHEVSNMIKTSQRLCYGQLSIHIPILHQDMFVRDIGTAFVTRKRVKDEVCKLLEVDFSAFHREVLCRKPEAGIEREFVMMATIPDFILVPTFGLRQFMWQDLVGKDKRSPARIVLPILCSEELETLIVDAVGAFRWELCKTMLGASWNDVSQSSLTADYSDYIQFYRKNRDLSEEHKAKIKTQIQNCRNNMRDIFVSDYRYWLKYESQGVMRLNKVARAILYRHCSFAKPIRSQLEKQPMFSELANRFENIRNRRVTEIVNRYHRYTKTGAELEPELEEHLRFYRDL